MSPPRRPFGNQLPGRLQATMIKVLAAEMSDSGRLSRGKRYHADDAVIDITIGRGVVTAEVQGSRSDPYVVTIEADPGDGVPRRSEVWIACTCPDDTGTGADACKHGVAALLALGTEISIEPELLERWRSGRRHGRAPAPAEPTNTPDDTPSAGNVFDIRSGRPVAEASPSQSDDAPDEVDDDAPTEQPEREIMSRLKETDLISPMLMAPAAAQPPTFPAVDAIEHPRLGDATLDAVLGDALRHLRIRWE